jgi:protein-S-isoprenylcysteine O-methyltransferase Ste14
VSTPLLPARERFFLRVIDLGERLFLLILFASLVVRLSHSIWVRPYNVLALISEGFVAFLILVRRPAQDLSLRPLDWIVALAGTALPMLARAGGQALLPSAVGTVLMFAGLALALWAKLSLRRSFGLAAANRGAVAAGPYRLIRHPMYAGYIIIYIGFFLNNPLAWNMGLYIASVVLLVARVLAEEAVLTVDPLYRDYRGRVRFRLLPSLF